MKPLTPDEKAALEYYVRTPAESSTGFIDYAREIEQSPGVKFGCVLDQHIIPLRPGRVLTMIARPGHGKTTFGAALCVKEARRIVERKQTDKYVAFVTLETPVEELEAYMWSIHNVDGKKYTTSDIAWGRANVDELVSAVPNRLELPVWMFGKSLHKSDFDTPPMTMRRIYSAIQAVHKEYNLLPSLIMIDYLQKIPVPGVQEKVTRVSDAMDLVNELAINAKTPIILTAQAGRVVDSYKDPIPDIADAQWSSVIEQVSDVVLGLWRPIKTHPDTETIRVGGIDCRNIPELFVVRLLKQRMEQGYGTWPIYFQTQTMIVRDYNRVPLD